MSKAYAYTGVGGPEVETFVDRPVPEPGSGELLVAVRAAGVNPVDWKLRNGFRRPGAPDPQFPVAFGSEVAGTVERVGPGVEGFAPGDAVFGSPLTGGYAEHTLLPAAVTARLPEGLSFTDAATLPVAAATAWDGIQQLALPEGAVLLVTGAGGGVGVAAVQIARAAGLRVVGVASAGKRSFVESLGARHVASGPDFAERVRAITPEGVDAVFDLVGGEVLEAAASLLRDRSKLISAADRSVTALGGAPVERTRTAAVLDKVAALAAEGRLDPHVTAVYPLEQAGAALRAVEEGHARGKIVIEVAR